MGSEDVASEDLAAADPAFSEKGPERTCIVTRRVGAPEHMLRFVLDPQGKAIEGALKSLGVAGIDGVRQGKVFDIEVAGDDRASAEAALKAAAEKLLANTVVENYRVEIL